MWLHRCILPNTERTTYTGPSQALPKEEGTLPEIFYEATIALIPKPDTTIHTKKTPGNQT